MLLDTFYQHMADNENTYIGERQIVAHNLSNPNSNNLIKIEDEDQKQTISEFGVGINQDLYEDIGQRYIERIENVNKMQIRVGSRLCFYSQFRSRIP